MRINKADTFSIYTDGSCRGSTPKGVGDMGGSAFILVMNDEDILYEFSKGFEDTTCSHSEVYALERALSFLTQLEAEEGAKVSIHSDSMYCVKGFNTWMYSWKKRGWKNSNKKEIKYPQLWQNMMAYMDFLKMRVPVLHIPAHTGHVWNEYVDILAKSTWDDRLYKF